MALVNPLGGKNAARRFLISPNTETLIGDAGKTELRRFTKTRAGFEAVLELASRKGRRSRMTIVSTPRAVVFLEVPTDSSRLPQGGWLLSAIENDPLTGGTRTLFWQGDSTTVRNRSGATASVDRSGWVNVDNWMGFVVPVPGVLTYKAPTTYNRNGSAEDFLRFLPKNPHAPRAAILLPGMDAAQTARTLKHTRWKITRKKCRLVVAVPGQKRIRLKVPLH
jgi:hypothetical protein